MKVSLIQPMIERGNIPYNVDRIQKLITKASGDLLILPEYALTGSLVLDLGADITKWAEDSQRATESLIIPPSRTVLLNSLVNRNGLLFNCCQLLPTNQRQDKLFPDGPESQAGIQAGDKQHLFQVKQVRFKAVICTDLRHIDQISTAGLDFLAFIFHFTNNNFSRAFQDAKEVSLSRRLPVLVSSLVSDQNIGRSCLINGEKVTSLGEEEGMLECNL